MDLPQYGSPRTTNLISPGLTLRTGKTPRPDGTQGPTASRAFEFHDYQPVSWIARHVPHLRSYRLRQIFTAGEWLDILYLSAGFCGGEVTMGKHSERHETEIVVTP